jgi:hypothetical protein
MSISRKSESKTGNFRLPVGARRSVRSLLSVEQLNQAIARESLRVDRAKGEDLSLVLFKLANPRRNALSTVRLIKAIIKRIRVTDDVGWFDHRQIGLLLPDTTVEGAQALIQQICDSVASKGAARPVSAMYTYPADNRDAAEMPPRAVKVAS